jgi:L-glutamine-phosphate cytidylyltransferase
MSKTKAAILAAGMGTRLGTMIPKPLTSLQDEHTVIDFQVRNLARKVGEENIFVVVGYKKEIIMEMFPDLTYVYNEAYPKTNTAKSLLKALRKIDGDDVLWMNGDVYFEHALLDLIVSSEDSACLVNTEKVSEEEIKYTLNEKGYIHNLSKQVKNGVGEAVGINLIKAKDLKMFKDELEKVEPKDYFEKALENLTLAGKISLLPISVGNYFCKEIDFEEDLQEVKKFLNSRKK